MFYATGINLITMEDDDWFARGVLVSNLPTCDDMTRDKLELHFSKRSNGGGDVEEIVMLDDYTALVKFKEKKSKLLGRINKI